MDFHEQMLFYQQYYKVAFSSESIFAGGQVGIIEPQHQICRFCGKQIPDVTFNNISHAIPEMIGNKALISSSECDKCNSIFNIYENNFDSFLGTYRTLNHLEGKTGVPNYCKDDLKISHKEHGEISISWDNPKRNVKIDNKFITVSTGKRSFVPIAVYKLFSKIALSLLPYESLNMFDETKKWLIDRNQENNQCVHFASCGFVEIKDVSSYLDHLFALVFIRSDDSLNLPYCQLILAFGSLIFQVIIPCPEKDKFLFDKSIEIPPCLFPFEKAIFNAEYLRKCGEPLIDIICLGSHESIKVNGQIAFSIE